MKWQGSVSLAPTTVSQETSVVLTPTYFAPRRLNAAIISGHRVGSGTIPTYGLHSALSFGGPACAQMSVKCTITGSASRRKHGAPHRVPRQSLAYARMP